MPNTLKMSSWGKRWPIPVGSETAEFVVKNTTDASYMGTNDVNKIAQITSKGITIKDCYVMVADADTHATPTAVFDLQVTDGTTTKTLISGATTAQAGGLVRPTSLPATEDGIGFVTTNKNFWIQIKWTTAAATAAAVALWVGLTLDGFYVAGAVTE